MNRVIIQTRCFYLILKKNDKIEKHFIQTKLRLSHTSKDDPHGKQ